MKLFISVLLATAFVGLSEQACGHDFEQAFLHKHNEYRSHHGAAPLQLSAEINHWAQQWADHLASSGMYFLYYIRSSHNSAGREGYALPFVCMGITICHSCLSSSRLMR